MGGGWEPGILGWEFGMYGLLSPSRGLFNAGPEDTGGAKGVPELGYKLGFPGVCVSTGAAGLLLFK